MRNSEIILILMLIVLAVYGNSLFNDFVWDDLAFIVDNSFIRQFKFLPDLFLKTLNQTSPTGRGFGAYYRPLFLLSFMFDYNFWNLDPFFYHFVNVILYIFNVILVFILILKLTKHRLISFLTALFFGLHPVHTEAVAPVFNRMDLLVSFFMFSSFILFIRALEKERFKRVFYFFSLILFIFGLLSKEFAFILPIVFIIYDLYFVSDFKIKNIFQRKYFYLSCLTIEILYFFIRFLVLKENFLGGSRYSFTSFIYPETNLWQISIVLQTLFQYLKILFFPIKLTVVYLLEIKPIWHIELICVFIFLVSIFSLIFLLKNKYKEISFFLCWFFITLLPVLNIISIGNRIAEHYVYLASLSFCFLLGFVFSRALENNQILFKKFVSRKVIILIIFLISFFYAYKTILRNYDWRNESTLWRKEAQVNPNIPLVHTNLGNVYFTQGLYDKAIQEYNISISLNPVNPKALNSLGAALIRIGLFKEGLQRITHASKLDPKNAIIYNNLGRVYNLMGSFDLAIKNHKEAIQLNPGYLPAYYDLGIAYFNKKSFTEALSQFNKVIILDPSYGKAYYGIGLIFSAQGKVEQAIKMFEKSLDIDPNFKTAKEKLVELKKELR